MRNMLYLLLLLPITSYCAEPSVQTGSIQSFEPAIQEITKKIIQDITKIAEEEIADCQTNGMYRIYLTLHTEIMKKGFPVLMEHFPEAMRTADEVFADTECTQELAEFTQCVDALQQSYKKLSGTFHKAHRTIVRRNYPAINIPEPTIPERNDGESDDEFRARMLRESAINFLHKNAEIPVNQANKDIVIVSMLAGMACRQKACTIIQSEVPIMQEKPKEQ